MEEKELVERLSLIRIPSSVFRNPSLSAFEAIVEYLKKEEGLSLHEIGLLLDRDERNIWTVSRRAEKKR